MFDDTHDSGEQLFETDTTENEAAASSQGTGDSDQPTEKVLPPTSSQVKQRQIDAWTRKVMEGEASLESLPKDLEWLKPHVKSNVEQYEKEHDIDALVEKKLNERLQKEQAKQAEARFSQLKEELNSMNLAADEQAIIQTKFSQLMRKGLNKTDALEEAKEFYESTVKGSDAAKEELKKRMQIKVPIKPLKEEKKPEYGTPEFTKKGDSKSRVEEMERILKESGHR